MKNGLGMNKLEYLFYFTFLFLVWFHYIKKINTIHIQFQHRLRITPIYNLYLHNIAFIWSSLFLYYSISIVVGLSIPAASRSFPL